jgi:hypothetical protein
VTGGVGQAGAPSTQINGNPSIDENSSTNRTDQNKPTVKPREKDGTGLEWEVVPTDIVFRIFDVLTEQVFQSQGAARADALRAILHFGSVSISQRHSFQEFLKNYPNGAVLRPEIFAFTHPEWKQEAKNLKENCEKLREDFLISKYLIAELSTSFYSSNSSSAANQEPDLQIFDQFEGIQIDFKTFTWGSEVGPLISLIEGKVIKLDAKNIGRERVLNEVIPCLKKIPVSCPIVFDISGNHLVSKDLVPLIEFMAANPTIYRLDLSENPLFEDKDNHKEVVQLFACGGPLTHCYLSNVGFNDMAAQELKQAIAKSSVVEHLDLRFNHLSANGVAAVIKALIPGAEPDQKVITSIREVRLFNNAYDDGADDEIIRGAVRQGIKNIKEFTKNDPELGAVVTGGWAIELRAVCFNYIFQIGRYPEDPDEFNTGAVLNDLSARQMKL